VSFFAQEIHTHEQIQTKCQAIIPNVVFAIGMQLRNLSKENNIYILLLKSQHGFRSGTRQVDTLQK